MWCAWGHLDIVILMVWRILLQCCRPFLFFLLAPRCNVTGLKIHTGVQLGDHAHILKSFTLGHFASTEIHHIRSSSHYLRHIILHYSEATTSGIDMRTELQKKVLHSTLPLLRTFLNFDDFYIC